MNKILFYILIISLTYAQTKKIVFKIKRTDALYNYNNLKLRNNSTLLLKRF